MKRNMMFLALLFGFLVFPFQTKAICNSNEKIKMVALANNINSTYVFDENSKTFQITLTNIPEGFAVKDVNNDISHYYSQSELTLTGYQPGGSYRFDITSSQIGCSNEVLKSFYITLPVYNLNYMDPLCKGLEDYDICQKWGKYITNRSQFETEIKKINQGISISEEEVVEQTYTGVFDKFAEFFVRTYYIILPIIITGGLFGIYKLNKKEQLF